MGAPRRILFVGLGGAGQRHLRIFRDLLPEAEMVAFRSHRTTPLLNPDFTVDSSSTVSEKYRVREFSDWDAAWTTQPDLCVISNPTSLHLKPALEAARRGVAVFMEKPFSHSLEGFSEFRELVASKKTCFYMAYVRRHHPQIRKVKEMVGRLGKITSATFHVASYVPSWHPYEDFRKLYACRKELGGGVLLTEIHEFDLCYWFFGMPETVKATGGNMSEVKMDVEDTAQVTLGYEGATVKVNLSMMQRNTGREFRIECTQGKIEWNAQDNTLWVEELGKAPLKETLGAIAFEGIFREQTKAFLATYPKFDVQQLETAYASLKLVELAKASMES